MSETEFVIPAEPQAGMSAEALDAAAQQAEILSNDLEELAKIVEGQLDLSDPAGLLRLRAASLRADRFRIVVVGGFSRGKSTLLNAVLGTDILPQKVTPSTAIITMLEYAERPRARVSFLDGNAPDEILTVDEFRARYVLSEEDISDGKVDTDRFSLVDHAVVSYPVDLCRHRVELVDSPGLQDEKTRTERTIRFLHRADAVVMVLDATALLTEDELHFLDTVLLPEGLKNIFFVINKWNLIEQQVLRPADAAKEYADLEARIESRLAPFCRVGARDLSTERIFRVDALGALKARMRNPPSIERLEETNLPAFERALQRFLVEERRRVKLDVVLGTVKTVSEEVHRFIATQEVMAGKSIEEIEGELRLLEPKLERLRGIRKHILAFLDAQSANLRDRLTISFQKHIERIEARLPEEVEEFDLTEITQGSMVWKSLTDWARSDENKFANKVKRCVEPQLRKLLERHFAAWRQSAVKNEIQAVTKDVDTHLQEEAAEYQRVMREIEDQLGIHGTALNVDALVEQWLHSPDNREEGAFELSGVGAIGDMSWLIGSIAVDIAAEVVAHMATAWIPIVGLIISAARLLWREAKLRQQIKEKIVLNATEGLRRLGQVKAALIRERVEESFAKLKNKVAGSINDEIAIVEASLQTIIDRKRDKETSVEEERQRLASARNMMGATIGRIRSAAS